MFKPSVDAPAFVPLSSTFGPPQVAKPWLKPLIATGFVIVGKAESRLIVLTVVFIGVMANWISFGSAAALASSIACRNEPAPELLVFVTTNEVSVAATGAENSDVSNGAAFRVAVAVTNCPKYAKPETAALIVASPLALVATF